MEIFSVGVVLLLDLILYLFIQLTLFRQIELFTSLCWLFMSDCMEIGLPLLHLTHCGMYLFSGDGDYVITHICTCCL